MAIRSSRRTAGRRFGPLLAMLFVLLAAPAVAEDSNFQSAEELQTQLQAWIDSTLGPLLPPGDKVIRIEPEGDHYRIFPASNDPGVSGISASLRHVSGTRWTIGDLRLPPEIKFTVTLPSPGPQEQPLVTDFGVKIGHQDLDGVVDTAAATPSQSSLDAHDIDLAVQNARQHQQQHINIYQSTTAVEPVSGDRFAVHQTSTAEGWAIASQSDSRPPLAVEITRATANSTIAGVSRDNVTASLIALGRLVQAAQRRTGMPDAPLSSEDRADVRALLGLASELLGGMSMDEKLEGVRVTLGGIGKADAGSIIMIVGSDTPKGRLHLWIDMGVRDLRVSDLPEAIRELVPRHVSLQPSVSGVALDDLRTLLLDAAELPRNDPKLQHEAQALLSHGVNFAMESLRFNLGPAELEGAGKLTASGPNDYAATARVTATGLDQLIDYARSNPEIQQVLPILIAAKGLSKPVGDKVVWDIVAKNGVLTVNGIDLIKPGGSKQPLPEGQPRRR